MNLAALLQAQAQHRPDAIALIAADGTLTFRQLDHKAARTAALLEATGLRMGDPVLVFQPMSCALYVALLAIFRLGLIATFVDPSAGREHIERCCALCLPRGFIGSARAHLLRLRSPALRRIPHHFSTGMAVPSATRLACAERLAAREEWAPVGADSPALMTFTSGSTGQPKVAVRSHGFLLTQHSVLAHHLALKAGDVDLSTLPIFALANLACGVTSVIPDADLRRPGAINPAPVWRQLSALKVSRCAASPAFLERLVEHAERRDQTLDHIQHIHTGGAPVFPRLLERLAKVAPRAHVVAVYGSTEAEPIAHLDAADVSVDDAAAMRVGRGLLAGPPVAELSLRILRAQWGTPISPLSQAAFEHACLPVGEAGEIVVSGAHVLRGYLGGQGDTETKFDVDGERWHRTGDMGYLDSHGRLWLLGRAGARVVDARGELHPFAVECVAGMLPGVRRSALLAHEGRRILAIEGDERQLNLAELKHVLAWAQLDAVLRLKRIPVDKRHNAKVDYPALLALLKC